jgi:Fe-S-cluster containining protein
LNAKGRRTRKIAWLNAAVRTGKIKNPPPIDCLRDCQDIGACCQSMVLWAWDEPWPRTEDLTEARQTIEKRGLPFEIVSRGYAVDAGNRPTGRHAWYLTCKMVLPDGLCGIYENRPEVCRDFIPGHDCLCVKHPGHAEASKCFEECRGLPVAQQ